MTEVEAQEYPKELECSICNDLYVRPVTLLCQHTYCRNCITDYHKRQSGPQVDDEGYQVFVSSKDRNPKCPLCRCTIVIPPNDNSNIRDLIQRTYGHMLEQRTEQLRKDDAKADMKDQIKEELRREMFNALLDETVDTREGGLIHIDDNVHEPDMVYHSPYVTVEDRSDSWSTIVQRYKYKVCLIVVLCLIVMKMVFKLGDEWFKTLTSAIYMIYVCWIFIGL